MRIILKILGPGLLFASTAIGVSHLVQSTRAGMEYGLGFLGAIILINVFKYPFFEYGTRYAAATGTSLIDGYKKLGAWAIGSYFFVMVISLFFVSAAVFQVTAAFLENLLGLKSLIDFKFAGLLLVVLSGYLFLLIGQFKALDILIKILGGAMFICVLVAFFMVLFKGSQVSVSSMFPDTIWTVTALPFAISLLGWMPTAVDLSTWNSLWTLEKIKATGYKPMVRDAVAEFAIGYWISAVLAICFVTLGAFLVYGTSITFEQGSAGFVSQVISLFTAAMGSWSYWIIAIAAFTIMYGTSIGVLDGYARAFARTMQVIFTTNKYIQSPSFYTVAITLTALGGLSICVAFSGNGAGFLVLIDVATTLSFLFAPVVAILNFKLVTHADFPVAHRPKKMLRVLSIIGILVLAALSVIYMLWWLSVI